MPPDTARAIGRFMATKISTVAAGGSFSCNSYCVSFLILAETADM
ncbi:hypothetical protein ACFOEY_13990 [Paracandidimonas soli]